MFITINVLNNIPLNYIIWFYAIGILVSFFALVSSVSKQIENYFSLEYIFYCTLMLVASLFWPLIYLLACVAITIGNIKGSGLDVKE